MNKEKYNNLLGKQITKIYHIYYKPFPNMIPTERYIHSLIELDDMKVINIDIDYENIKIHNHIDEYINSYIDFHKYYKMVIVE